VQKKKDSSYYRGLAKKACDAPQPAMQKWTEFAEFLEYLDGHKLESILEIGTLNGGVLKALRHIASLTANFVLVDYGDIPKSEIKKMPIADQSVQIIIGDSHSKEVEEKVGMLKPFDFILIDGDHSYEGVKKDFEMYSPMVRKGGIIAFHDILPHTHPTHKKTVGVSKFWKEITKEYEKEEKREFTDTEYKSDWGQWGGIGIIKL